MGTSGLVVNFILSRISSVPISQTISKEVRDTGFVVGKCENILLLTFMILEAYTALALVFAAKAIVRREDMSKKFFIFPCRYYDKCNIFDNGGTCDKTDTGEFLESFHSRKFLALNKSRSSKHASDIGSALSARFGVIAVQGTAKDVKGAKI